jgi:hypothetical protein
MIERGGENIWCMLVKNTNMGEVNNTAKLMSEVV